MKLRQKLAMVLAATMIVAAVPVTTMAYSKNEIQGAVSSYTTAEVTYDDGLKLVVDFEDSILTEFDDKTIGHLEDIAKGFISIADDHKVGTTFYVNAEDFTFNKSAYIYGRKANEADTKELLDRVTKAVKSDTRFMKTTTTQGAIVADTEVKINDFDKFFAMDKEKINEDTVVLKLDVEYYTNTEGATAKRTVEYTIQNIIDLDAELNKALGAKLELKDFTDLHEVYSVTAVVFDAKGTRTPWAGETVVEFLANDKLRVYVKAGITKGTNAEGEIVDAIIDDTKVAIPMIGQMTGKSPAVLIEACDSSSTVSRQRLPLTNNDLTSNKVNLVVKEGDVTGITINGGTLAGFTITENKQNVLKDGDTIVLDLGKYSDLVFVGGTVKATGEKAFAPNTDYFDTKVIADGQKLEITVKDGSKVGTTTGGWKLSGVQVEAKSLKYGAEVGDVNVTITSKNDLFAEVEVKLAEVRDFEVTAEVKPADLIAGRLNGAKDADKKAKFHEAVITVTEGVRESLDDKRWAYFQLPSEVYVKAEDFNDAKASSYVSINGEKAIDDKVLLKTDVNKDGYVTGFSLEFEYTNNDEKKGQMVVEKANTVSVTLPLYTPLSTPEGEYNVEIISKYVPEIAGEQVIANVVQPVEVTFDQKEVKVGLEKQEMGDITITEKADKMINEGELVLFLEDIKLETSKKDIVVTTTEGSKMDVRVKSVSSDKDGSYITLTVDREAKELSAITLSNLVGTVYRTVPEGGTDIQVYGSAIQDLKQVIEKEGADIDVITIEDYNAVPTKNTEDIGTISKANTVILTADATIYSVNGEEVEIDEDQVAYIDANNRMMAPARLIGEAFSVDNISFSNETGTTVVTFFNGSKVVNFTNGSNKMVVNGTTVTMDTPAVITNGRLFVPVRSLANSLGIKVSYEAGVATFTTASN
ncbi:MAG: copper amine oxidase N-terminal domain-containing protein [Cellulosilyticaceae bacterium]